MTLNWGGRALSEEFASRSHLAEATALDLFVRPTGAAKPFRFRREPLPCRVGN
jgi:hypothetical protein